MHTFICKCCDKPTRTPLSLRKWCTKCESDYVIYLTRPRYSSQPPCNAFIAPDEYCEREHGHTGKCGYGSAPQVEIDFESAASDGQKKTRP